MTGEIAGIFPVLRCCAVSKPGRPTDCTPELTAEFVKAVRSGASLTGAARYAGISLDSVRRWMTRGEAGEPAYAGFADGVNRALADVELRLATQLYARARQDPKLALAMLARRFPDEWGRTEKHEVSGPGGGALSVQFEDPSAELLRRLTRVADRGAAGGAG